MRKKIRRNKTDKDGYEYNFDGLDIRDFKPVPRPPWAPKPGDVAKMLKTARITIVLDDETVKFFKNSAKENGVAYQRMIREILKNYAAQNKKAA